MKYVRNAVATLAMFLIGFAVISLATGFADDARTAALIAFGCGVLWLLLAVWEETRRQPSIVAEAMRPDPFYANLIDDDDNLPWLIRGDEAPLRTEIAYTPLTAAEIIDGGRKPHWDTNIWGAVE